MKNIRPKQILANFKNFDYSEYLNNDLNKPKTSISEDFVNKFFEKTRHLDDYFVRKMRVFWFLEFLGFFVMFVILCTSITIIITIHYYGYFAIPIGMLLNFVILYYYNFRFLFKFCLNKIVNYDENFKTFKLLFNENQFKNFDSKNGPYEFQIALLLKGRNIIGLVSLGANGTMNRFKDNMPNLISCMYLVTKMLIYYFEQEK